MYGDASTGLDPIRGELDQRWRDYLDSHSAPADNDQWMIRAVSQYREEVVHFGAQLLNDCVIRPYDDTIAHQRFDEYRSAARVYDEDPAAWEDAFWARIRPTLSPKLQQLLDRRQN